MTKYGQDLASESVQDYLHTIYRLQRGGRPARTQDLARELDVRPASVTGMVRRLHEQGLVVHVPYRGTVLTPEGEEFALRLIRRHRLWELFLTEVLGLDWDEVHEEAHRLEHATSERVTEKLAEFLHEPEKDPHGQPIPNRRGVMVEQPSVSLIEVGVGQVACVVEVPDHDPDLLRRLARWGLVPGADVVVEKHLSPQWGLVIRLGADRRKLSPDEAAAIWVSPWDS